MKAISFHEPIFCEGNYEAKEKNNELQVIYADSNTNFCSQNEPNFVMKKENSNFFIKSSDFNNNNNWLSLNKKK